MRYGRIPGLKMPWGETELRGRIALVAGAFPRWAGDSGESISSLDARLLSPETGKPGKFYLTPGK